MFSIVFEDIKSFNNFLSINEIDFVDVFLQNDFVKFVSNSNEAYAEYKVIAKKSASQEPFVCRMGKNFLKSVGQDDVMLVSCSDGTVCIELYNANGDLLYSCKFLQQIVANSTYADRWQLANQLGDYAGFNLGALEGLYQTARLNGGVLIVNSGIGAVMLKEAGAIYKKVNVEASFTVNSYALACLKKCSNRVGNLKDMLVARQGGFTVFVQKSRMECIEDYDILQSGRFGAKCTADIDLNNLFRFLYKTKLAMDSVAIDIKLGECILETGHCITSQL